MKRIEYYSNYREFLKDLFDDYKKRFPHFSNRYFCRKAGVKSPSLLKEVIEGKRNLTETTIPAFSKGFGLNKLDSQYFYYLVQFNQSKDPQIKQRLLDQMGQMTRKVRQEVVPTDHYAYYASWYNPVIRELACLLKWDENYSLLAKSVQPEIKKVQAKESVELLLRLGFLIKSDDGTYSQSHPAITTGSEVTSLGVRSLNHELSKKGMEAINRFSVDERDVSSLTIGISEKSYDLITQEIQEFKRRIIRIVDDDQQCDQVYNVNVHLFPLSKKA
jgi:uncharacterized protein (TIGR02147 family)